MIQKIKAVQTVLGKKRSIVLFSKSFTLKTPSLIHKNDGSSRSINKNAFKKGI